jgi:FKBP-type peptidyl-prolyl cis-trans isomerase 2
MEIESIDEISEDTISVTQFLNYDLGEIIMTDKGFGRVIQVGRDFIKIDFNHELAGKKLIFDIELVSVNNG